MTLVEAVALEVGLGDPLFGPVLLAAVAGAARWVQGRTSTPVGISLLGPHRTVRNHYRSVQTAVGICRSSLTPEVAAILG